MGPSKAVRCASPPSIFLSLSWAWRRESAKLLAVKRILGKNGFVSSGPGGDLFRLSGSNRVLYLLTE